jgi:hypothetical protein
MSKLNAHGFVVQEVLCSPDLRRTCSICGAKRKIGNLRTFLWYNIFLKQKGVMLCQS